MILFVLAGAHTPDIPSHADLRTSEMAEHYSKLNYFARVERGMRLRISL